MRRTVVLMILDGWGVGPANDANPIHVANPQNFKYLEENYPVTSLQASGISVGLPWSETGNSEVGHLTIGAGKTIYQYYPKITMAIQDGTFFENEVLKSAFAHARKNNSGVNLVGLLTKANTHASLEHLQALLLMAEKENVANVKMHLFGDAIDSPPKSILGMLEALPAEKLATLTGRYYAMDRNENWSLTQKTYECLTGKSGTVAPDPKEYLKKFFEGNRSEEFLPPLRVDPAKAIASNDAVVFFNFREDSIRQMVEPFILPNFDRFARQLPENLYVATLTRYAENYPAPFAFAADKVEHPLGKILSELNKTQLRLAETYKYAHVTYFFNGHQEEPYKNEYRVLVPSLNITHPEEHPELMASAITDRLLEALSNQAFDFILVNYSNPDTIGHSGNYEACLKVVQVMDQEMGRIIKVVEQTETVLIITSDHGNMEQELNPMTGVVETQHQNNPVPFYLIAKEFRGRKFPNYPNLHNDTLGMLADVAPTILSLMQIPKPPDMTGENLLKHLL
ncbi:MAG TPA: 2,3-bisphosphoglycerate-independent phosphoglycerate mutase [Candidatus Paceibacterota bacterium]